MVDYNAAFKKPFLDIKNLAIGILLSILPVINWFAVGYALECTGLTKKKVGLDKSPEWTGWGSLFVKGILSTVIGLVYFIPALIVLLIAVASVLGVIFTTTIWPAIMSGVGFENAIAQNWGSIAPVLVGVLPLILVTILLFILAAYVIPVAIMRYLAEDCFKCAFEFGKVFRKAFTGGYFVAWLLAFVIAGAISFVLSWIPFVGSAAGSFIGSVISYTILGQAYKEIKK